MIITVKGVPVLNFFNTILTYLEAHKLGPLSTIIFILLTFYLLWGAIKGNIKFGLRILFVTFYPVEPHNTWMGSLLVNVFLFNVWSVSLLHFVTMAFGEYTVNTQIHAIFYGEIRNMVFFKYFFKYNVFIYVILGVSVLSLVYLFVMKPKKLIDRLLVF